MGSTEPPAGDQVAHFLVPAAHIWDDVVHTCSHQRIFCSRGCVERWLTRTSQDEGYVMDLATLWRFASRWYEGRLERGYQRRDPATAADYMRESRVERVVLGAVTPRATAALTSRRLVADPSCGVISLNSPRAGRQQG